MPSYSAGAHVEPLGRLSVGETLGDERKDFQLAVAEEATGGTIRLRRLPENERERPLERRVWSHFVSGSLTTLQ
jgi:hypothetical protein